MFLVEKSKKTGIRRGSKNIFHQINFYKTQLLSDQKYKGWAYAEGKFKSIYKYLLTEYCMESITILTNYQCKAL